MSAAAPVRHRRAGTAPHGAVVSGADRRGPEAGARAGRAREGAAPARGRHGEPRARARRAAPGARRTIPPAASAQSQPPSAPAAESGGSARRRVAAGGARPDPRRRVRQRADAEPRRSPRINPSAAPGFWRRFKQHAARHARTCVGGFAVSDPVSSRRLDGRPVALRERIATRTARVGVVGLGYVGLPLAVEFARAGFDTTGIDLDTAEDRRGHQRDVATSPTWRPTRSRAWSTSRRLRATDRLRRASPSSTRSTSACRRRCARRRTPTCPTSSRRSKAIAAHLHPGMLIILESTTYPGTTEELVQPMLEASGLKAGVDFFLAFSPERVDPGNPTFNTHNVPKVVGGVGPESTRAGVDALRRGDRDDRAGQLAARRRDGEAAREHVPRGEHRPGQRDRADVRPARHRRLGGGRRRRRPSRSGSCRSIRAPASAATASRSIRSTCRGRRSRPASIRASSSSPARSTAACRTSSSTRSPTRSTAHAQGGQRIDAC